MADGPIQDAMRAASMRDLNELNELLHDDQCFDHRCGDTGNTVDSEEGGPFECISCRKSSGTFELFCVSCGSEKIAKLEAQLAEVKRVNAMQCDKLCAMELKMTYMAQERERQKTRLP